MYKKKLLHIIPSMDPKTGGPCQGIRNMHYVDERDYEVEIICLDDSHALYINEGKIKKYALGKVQNRWQYAPLLVKWLVEHLPYYDAVIINGLWLYHSYAAWRAMRKLMKKGSPKFPKIYVMPHGMLDPYFQKAPHRWLKAIRNWFYWKLIESKVVNDADGLLFTCEEELLLARTTFTPYTPKAEINIGYGIQEPPTYTEGLSKAFYDRLPQLEGKRYYLFMSRIHNKKGVDLLLKAYKIMYDNYYVGTSDFPLLLIAGPGMDTAYGKHMQQLANALFPNQEMVHFPGMVSGDAKWGAYYGAEAFILPSHQENFGIVVPEALACGIPVLITNKINIWREIQAGQGGFVEDDTLAGTIELLVQWEKLDGLAKDKMKKQAQEVYKQHFRIEVARERLIAGVLN